MGKAIGIDLGTTNTAVAVIVDGRPRVLEDEKGYKVLPSVVSLKAGKSGEISFVVGQAAKNLIITRPDRTIYAIKRLMGRRFDSPEVQQMRKRVAFEIAESEDGMCKVRMADRWYTPVEVSALILDVAKATAERCLGEIVDEAVITVPAYFNHAQRSATLEAARRAGLRCERILNEPTAAALAYGHRKDIERTIVVYDLGGGTFDVSVLRLSHGLYEVLSTSGETHLGGEDFDQRIVDHLADNFLGSTGVDLRKDPTALQRLKDAGERAKCELSFTDRTPILIPRVTMVDNLDAALSRLELEGLVEDLIVKTLEITKAAIRDAGLRLSSIDEVILVGGQTRMPRVREAIATLFQKEPSRTVHPEEVVAIGAAVHAASLYDRSPKGGSTVLLDVTPFDLGIQTAGGHFEPVIKRNSQVPTQATKTFYTNKDGQDTVKVTVRQGESATSDANEFLGEFVMTGLTKAARMETKVEVTFKLDSNGMLHVSAVEPGTGEKKKITIRNYAEYAKTAGGVKVELEGDGAAASAAAAQARAEAEKAQAPAKEGLLSRLFGGKKKATPAPAPAAPEAALPDFVANLPEEPIGLGLEAISPVESEATLDGQLGLGDLSVSDLDLAPISLDVIEPLNEADLSPMPLAEAELEAVDELESFDVGLEDAFALEADEDEDLLVPAPADSELLDAFAQEDNLEAELFALDGDDSEDEDEDEDTTDDPFSLDPFAEEATPSEARSHAGPTIVEGESIEDFLAGLSDHDTEELPEEEPTVPQPFQPFRPGQGQHRPSDATDIFSRDSLAAEFEDEDSDWELVTSSHHPPSARPLEGPTAPKGELDLGDLGFEEGLGDDIDPLSEDGEVVIFAGQTHEEPASQAVLAPAVKPATVVEDFEDEDTDPGPRQPLVRRPARLKVDFRRTDAMVREYRQNIQRGGCFLKTSNPLREGRTCELEIRAPGLSQPILIPGVVTWSSASKGSLGVGRTPGMDVEYRLSQEARRNLERILGSLGV